MLHDALVYGISIMAVLSGVMAMLSTHNLLSACKGELVVSTFAHYVSPSYPLFAVN